ncbi:hypothetical protein KC973_00685 [Candidatus Saccharibacteria bacterium]|nr:hypothetical protein [Candidatus Saccharibacteria bacterium]
MKQTLKLLTMGILAGAVFTLLRAPQAHAASITVSTDTHPSACTLDEAIENINDGAQTNSDCAETGAYGTDDTINLPSGTVTLTADLPQITESVTITGAGMGETIIDGDGQWAGVNVDLASGNFALADITVTAFKDNAALINDAEIVTVSRVEVDGTGVADSMGFIRGLAIASDTVYDNTINISDMYIHGFDIDASGIQVLAVGYSGQSETNLTVDRVTIARIRNTGLSQAAIFGAASGTVNGSEQFTANVSNITVADVTSVTSMVLGIGVVNFNGVSLPAPVLNLTNATVDNIAIPASMPANIPVVAAIAAAQNDGDVARSQLNASNVIISNSSGSTINCGTLDIGPIVGGAGVGMATLTSNGGNMSDDNSTCKDSFTQPTDQNNVSNLASFLAPLADNGGYVPTMALLQGSPAIDAGVTVAGLTTDARLVARPQGTAFDSGAYESPYSKAITTATTASLANTGQSITAYILIALTTLTLGSALLLTRKFKS